MFRSVAEDGTFTRAAERLRVSQSAISRQVKLLEEELGGVLLHRGARRVSLTPAGELLLKMANRVRRDMQDVVVATAPGHPLARERTVVPSSLGKFPLILYESGSNTRRVLDQFFVEEAVPMNVAMETENVEIIKAMVASGLGITIIPFQAIARDLRAHRRLAYRRLRGRRLFRETGWVYLRTDYL